MKNESGKNSIDRSYNEWKENVYKKFIGKHPEREKEFTTVSFTPVRPLYIPDKNYFINFNEKIGYPGTYPFTRGIQPTMYRGKLWTMRQYAGYRICSGI